MAAVAVEMEKIQPTPLKLDRLDDEESKPVSPKNKGEVRFKINDSDPPLPVGRSTSLPRAINLTIYTIGGESCKITFSTGRHTTADNIMKEMIGHLRIPEEMANVFSIWMVSKHLQLQLKSYHAPVKLFKRWKEFLTQYTNVSREECQKDLPILTFRRNAFLPIKEEKRLIAKRNSKIALTLLYNEAVYNIVKGLYPLTNEEILELAGYQCAIEKGNTTQTPDSLKEELGHFYPSYMLPSTGGVKTKLLNSVVKGRGSIVLENDLCERHGEAWKKVNAGVETRRRKSVDIEKSAVSVSLGAEEETKLWEDSDLQFKLLYLQRCWSKPYYGCVMFRGQVERKTSNLKQLLVYSDRSVVVAINPDCVHIFSEATESSPREVMLYLAYDCLLWDFQPATEEGENFYSSLWLQFDSMAGKKKVAKRLQVFSRQAPMMDAMITRCVDCLNDQDEEMHKLRVEQNKRNPSLPIEAPTHSIKTGLLETQTKNFREDKLICETIDPSDSGDQKFPFFKRKRSLPEQAPDESTIL